MSYEKFVMDADFCGALHTYLDGVTIDDNAAGAATPSSEVGPGSHFFGCAPHAWRNYQTAFWDSASRRQRALREVERGGRGRRGHPRQPAHGRSALAEYEAPPLDEAIDEALKDFIRAGRRQWKTLGIESRRMRTYVLRCRFVVGES